MDLFPTEIRRLRGEKFVLNDGELELLITIPQLVEIESDKIVGSLAKDKKLFRKSIKTVKKAIDYIDMLINHHDFGASELKSSLNVLIIGLESLKGNSTQMGISYLACEKARGTKMWITRSARFKTWFKIYNLWGLIGAEIPILANITDISRWKIYNLLIGNGIGKLNERTWMRLMKEKPFNLDT